MFEAVAKPEGKCLMRVYMKWVLLLVILCYYWWNWNTHSSILQILQNVAGP